MRQVEHRPILDWPQGSVKAKVDAEPDRILEVVRLREGFGILADQITTRVVQNDYRGFAHEVSARVTIPVPPRPPS